MQFVLITGSTFIISQIILWAINIKVVLFQSQRMLKILLSCTEVFRMVYLRYLFRSPVLSPLLRNVLFQRDYYEI